MIPQTEALVFVNEKRNCFQTDDFRGLATLPNEANADILTQKLGFLQKFSDNTLAPTKSCILQPNEKYCIVLLPLVGAIEVNKKMIGVGEIGYYLVEKGDNVAILNPYDTEFVNYIEIWFRVENTTKSCFFDTFDLDSETNTTVLLKNDFLPISIYIAKLSGKSALEISLLEKANRAFAFNVMGSIEVQERLLFERDAILVWNCETIAVESLANESILLLIA